jgi:twitching motility protein PilJ
MNAIDGHRAARWLPGLIGAGLVLLVIAAALLVLSARYQQLDRQFRRHVAELTVIAAALPSQATAAGRGDDTAFGGLGDSQQRLRTILDEIESGRSSFAPLSSPSALQLGDDAAWRDLEERTAALLAGRQAAVELKTWAREARTQLPPVLAGLADVVAAPGGAPVAPVLPRFEQAAERLGADLQSLAAGGGDITSAAGRIATDAEVLAGFLKALAGEEQVAGVPRVASEALARLSIVRGQHRAFAEQVRGVLDRADRMAAAQRAGQQLARSGDELYGRLTRLAGAASPVGLLGSPWPTLAVVGLAILTLGGALLAWLSAAGLRRAAELQSRQNQRNQEAILRLLDEMSSLADGDLTVQASVTDDITGAIADSINYAIEALRDLVATINDTALQLDQAARQTQAAAGHLAKGSVAQSKQVAGATDAVGGMAARIEEVSGNSERAADVARHAVGVAHKGGDAVRRTIDGMNVIRENIQETSKRIKRLGESSQEIGNIVELINDIAEQTNILALNASIQASMAGEAGRGFAVVADEVQRLAERAGNATRQIEVLVRTIQTDTNEAVVSMERTTTDVVGGALLAENAGAALGEIEQVSNQIASLVQNISASARQQSAAAVQITRTMQVLREISQQSADNTHATSTAIGRLAEMSAQLRKSVSGFRLPEEADSKRAPTGPGGQSSAGTPRRADGSGA